MDFLEKIFSNTTQETKNEDRFSHAIKRILTGNSSEINPQYLYELQSYCQTKENANKIMDRLSRALDEFCDSPLPIFKALKLILLLLKLSSQTFTPAARNYLPEIQTIVNVSFDKPAVPHVNTIHRYANIIYLHLSKNVPLPEMKIPPRPKQTNPQPQPQHQPPNQRQPQRPGRSRLDNNNNDEGSLFDSNDNSNNNKYEESGSFLSGFLDLGPKRHQQSRQQQPQQQAQQPQKGSQNQEGPRMPAVFASGGAFQGVRSRISQPLDFGYEDENTVGEEVGESLLNFNDSNKDQNDGNNDLLVGAFDDIGNEPKSNNDSIDQTNFVFSGAEPASTNAQNTDLNAPFNPFGADGFNPTFPDVNDYEKNNEQKKQNDSYRRPFVASGPKPKFDPTKMKKKPKIVPNTVPQDNFDPFGTGSAANAFDNIPKDPQPPQKKMSLAEKLGQKPEPQKQDEVQKKPQKPGKNVFDLLGIPGSESDDGNEAETQVSSSTKQNEIQNKPQKGSSNVFDALGDDLGSFEALNDEKQKVTSNEEKFEPFGDSPQLKQEINQVQKNSSANVFDMLDDNAFTVNSTEQKQPSQAASNNELFGDFDSLDQTKQEQKEQLPKNSSANVFDMLDDNAFSTPANSASNIPPKQQQKEELFEPFGSSSQKQENANNDLFEPFGSSSTQKQTQETKNDDLFESFGPSSTQQQQKQTGSKGDDLFEPFGSSTTQQQNQQANSKSDLFEPFGSSNQQQQPPKSSGNVFDMLDDNNVAASPVSSNKSSQLQAKSSAADDLFDSFDKEQASPPPQKNSSANVFDMLGDDAFTASPTSAPKTQPESSKGDLFEQFSSTTPQQVQKANSKNDLFEPFGSSTTQQQTKSNDDLFEPFGSSSTKAQQKPENKNEDLFEPFGSSNQQKQTDSKNDLFEPFGTSNQQQQIPQKSSGNVFDMLDDNNFNRTPPASNKSSDDLFAKFNSAPAIASQQKSPSQPQQSPKNSSANVFDMLGDNAFGSNPAPVASNGGNDLFDSFVSAPNISTPQNSSNVFDLLDSTNTQSNTPSKNSTPKKSNDPYDIFG